MDGVKHPLPDRVLVRFTCKACGVTDQEVPIRLRAARESLKSWMTTVQRAVGNAHAKASPRCRSMNVDLKIPVAEGHKVGETRQPAI